MLSQKENAALIYNISDEKERIYEEFDRELRALSEPSADMFSHGFIFHQSASHVGLTENVLHLKGYEIKENIVSLSAAGAAKHRHHTSTSIPSFPLAPFTPSTHPLLLLF